MSLKVIECGTNRKLVYELLLVVYSNFGRITHRFRDTSCFNAENHILPIPLVFDLEFEYGDEIWRQKTRIMGLLYGEEIMIVGQIMWTQSTSVTDGRTDRRTHLR